jgi:6-phosphogluconolactonase
MPTQPEIRILNTAGDLFEAAASEFAAQASAAIRANGKFTVALSGGSTPKTLYSLFATKPGIPWDKVCIFWGEQLSRGE